MVLLDRFIPHDDRLKRIAFTDFPTHDAVIEHIVMIKGHVWLDRPHEGLDGLTPTEAITDPEYGLEAVWAVEFGARPTYKKDPREDLF